MSLRNRYAQELHEQTTAHAIFSHALKIVVENYSSNDVSIV